jgi:hypothetical protein
MIFFYKCHNPSFRLVTKARDYKLVGQKGSRGSHLMLLGVQKSVKEWTLTLPSELPFWKLESQWTLKFLKSNCKGQIALNWDVLYIIRKILKFKCLKWAHMTHLDIWNTNSSQKKSRESNWQFDFRPLKVGNYRDFLACRWRATYRWKASGWGLQLYFRPHFNRRSKHKVMGPQSCRSPNFENFGTSIWESRDKKPFGCGPCGGAQSIL